jgi:hypothetical protein
MAGVSVITYSSIKNVGRGELNQRGAFVRGKGKIPEDRRKLPRIDFHLPVAIGGQKGLKEIRNFGVVGVFIQTENPSQFKIGSRILLVTKLPHEKKPMRVRAEVIHVSEKGIGVEFLDVIPEDIMALERCFSIFKHTIPMPGK